MRLAGWLVAIAVGSLCCTAIAEELAHNTVVATVQKRQWEFRYTGPETVRLGDPIPITVEFINRSSTPKYLRLSPGNLPFRISAVNGKHKLAPRFVANDDEIVKVQERSTLTHSFDAAELMGLGKRPYPTGFYQLELLVEVNPLINPTAEYNPDRLDVTSVGKLSVYIDMVDPQVYDKFLAEDARRGTASTQPATRPAATPLD